MNTDGLSERDRAVLRSIFDPTATIGDVIDQSDQFLEEDEELDTPEWRESRELCARAVALAEAGELESALQLLRRATATPRPAAHSDTAQVLRLMQRDDGCDDEFYDLEAMTELNRALELTAGKRSRCRAQALCQRGLLLRKRGLDDAARVDFAEAAKLGSSFAKKQVVELNPYAALCNQMLSQVMRGETDIKI
ncbi:Tetratricopeptide repeat protein 36 [Eumeta japonica]|uniref:Tetratricopeptide repeat protein 36 n=1 Tax=Eumeta variegata TaxID=151549 RepID=A0A4C1WJI5_EUMVA|nr:Tetratricopeptide repeat protein 36 [Eumeta japonica]